MDEGFKQQLPRLPRQHSHTSMKALNPPRIAQGASESCPLYQTNCQPSLFPNTSPVQIRGLTLEKTVKLPLNCRALGPQKLQNSSNYRSFLWMTEGFLTCIEKCHASSLAAIRRVSGFLCCTGIICRPGGQQVIHTRPVGALPKPCSHRKGLPPASPPHAPVFERNPNTWNADEESMFTSMAAPFPIAGQISPQF